MNKGAHLAVRSFFEHPMRLIVDAHQDLAWNMLTFGRDYTRAAAETRQREASQPWIAQVNGDSTLGWPDYQRGNVALIFATLFATPQRFAMGDWDTQRFSDPDSAYRVYSRQLDTYYRLTDAHPDKFRLVYDQSALQAILSAWSDPIPHENGRPVGLIPLMECAEAVRQVNELDEWWERGVRIIGPAWAGTRFCGGTREPGPLTSEGRALLEAMADLGFTLDLSHMDWAAAREALDRYDGPIIASHSNAFDIIPHAEGNRAIPDDIIDGILERNGVIGIVPFNRFLVWDWKNSDPRSMVPLDKVAAQIDHICQRAGDAHHVGFGTDFDGGFGLQHLPDGLDTIADLHLIAPLLAQRGYTEADIDAIFGGNWINYLRKTLPN